jgi:two-component system, chemotaxis family, protein-glutamate methylesterase/glutaminase
MVMTALDPRSEGRSGPVPRSECDAPSRVLVVDDSVVVRQLVARVLGAEPTTELAGVAPNGRIALEKIARLRPDVVLLDLEMPEMDGFETLAEIRRTYPTLPVIIFSHLTSAGAAATLEALAQGATAFALKPRADGIGLAEEQVRDDLLPLIAGVRPLAPVPVVRAIETVAQPRRTTAVSAIVVAVSTGGPNALAEIVPSLPVDLSVPIFVVQHMPAVFTKMLAERLDRLSAVSVVEATDGEPAVPGRIYIAPGGRHLSLAGTMAAGNVRIHLTDDAPENSCRPAGDVLFRAAAAAYGPGTLAVVLTGMGSDGLRGCGAVHAAGGYVIAQTEASAIVASMPAAIAAAGLADAVVPLDQVAAELIRRTSPVRDSNMTRGTQ